METQAPKANRLRTAAGAGAGVLALVALAWWLSPGAVVGGSTAATFEARRGTLDITVVEGGSVEALDSLAIKSEVQGETRILSIVDEGYEVTQADVDDGKVLVELDNSDLLDRQTQQELEYQNALADYTEAQENFEIQRNQNESDVKEAELAVRFARLDLEKYLGKAVAAELIQLSEARREPSSVSLPVAASAEEETIAPTDDTEAEPIDFELAAPTPYQPLVDFVALIDDAKSGNGEAMQRLRQLENDEVVAAEEVTVAQSRLEGTQRLYEREFVTRTELETDTLSFQRKEIALQAARTQRELYVEYEFPKEAERLLSDYEESLRKLDRAKRSAVSRLSQAEGRLRSVEARYELQVRRREEIAEQLAKCTIRATKPGLVVYGTGNDSSWRGEENITEGARIRERQVLLTIPDTTQMGVQVSIHESFVEQVDVGQEARLQVDAFPDRPLEGVVRSIAVLPDAQNRWLNPDLKVYKTMIEIEDTIDWLRPGLSAEAEILVDVLEDVVYIPINAVQRRGRGARVFVVEGGRPTARDVELGRANDAFAEVVSGIEPGELVLLDPPAAIDDGRDIADDADAVAQA